MKKLIILPTLALLIVTLVIGSPALAKDYWNDETAQERAKRMAWWENDRFGMFIHWGLYAIPAGEWKGRTNYAEWIRNRAHIPLETYNQFLSQFNPTNFNADVWVKMAKDAGMKYIVITSKHHDGFCLWPSKVTDWDIESTPYKKDILGQMTEACKKYGVTMCFYYSIMDWHHPDYLPRRDWEKKNRPEGDANYDRYVEYMKAQLKELVENYHPAVIWFDGEWEGTWNHERGKDLYQYVRSLDPSIIINNRVDKGRRGMHGMTKAGEFRGDFGTPEQRIPDNGIPGVRWESCMTMNKHWGWNKNDKQWKSDKDLICKLVDIASKGGNFLLNIGPKPDGTFPDKAVVRLKSIGKWMKVNGESIYGTTASPCKKPAWGRITTGEKGENTTLYLHVFDWPKSGELTVDLGNQPVSAKLLADPQRKIDVSSTDNGIKIKLVGNAPDSICSVIKLQVKGSPKALTQKIR